ncbi:FtsK/SpoIIIE family DNA translocase [Pallidibacillus pasinlerensis]|uniref:DNA translocase FtsK n=1 Tax=Pallidibacillus pasinlerensis TaxID=2703818 RepID=A0ABX0A0W3_9BACI|nr:DNA translocase FtsK [Pallidibacillus pasinlerensis]NCU16472.1 DNA translocase FtsK [Pallidibacillus pasinlerensis]
MVKRKKRRTKSQAKLKQTIKFEAGSLILLALSIIAILNLGLVGRGLVHFFRFLAGEWYIILPLGLIVLSVFLIWKREWPKFSNRRLVGIYTIFIAILLLTHIALFNPLVNQGVLQSPSVIKNTWELFWDDLLSQSSTVDLGGGMIGAISFALLFVLFDFTGAKMFAYVAIIVGLLLLTGKSFSEFLHKTIDKTKSFLIKTTSEIKGDVQKWKEKREERLVEEEKKKEETPIETEQFDTDSYDEDVIDEPIISNFAERTKREVEVEEIEPIIEEEKEADDGDTEPMPMNFSEVENVDYQLPPISLLKLPRQTDQSGEYELVHANAAKLERTFQSFGVKARVTQVHIGPAVTKYEVHPDVGVKVSKIVSLQDDIALALAAKDIRMEAPIPGKSAIGIEVPNSEIAVVTLREVLEGSFDRLDKKLLIGLGRDITGDAVLAELNKMPHLLIAGATGSGKSVCVNGIITSILMRTKPHEVKMMMIDPKMVELNVYNGVPHLLAPVVTNPKKASQALKKVVSEMERRYELFSESGTRNIEGYNEYVRKYNAATGEKHPLLPFIVVIVDELADLMMVAPSDVEDAITRLAQMARAAGIHLIIATQRPSVDVITGVIKANIPSRIAFAVSSQTDSRTILDMGGAEKLLGRGDMLFLPAGRSKPVRIQGAFLSDEEVEEIVKFVTEQQQAQYQEEMIPDDTSDAVDEVDDELYEDAVQLVAELQTASVSMLQRRFRIGYTRAARLIDEMEKRGIVGPYEGSKPRQVLIPKPDDEELKSI